MTGLGAPARLGLFAAGLVVLFLAALGVGTATGDVSSTPLSAHTGAAHEAAPVGAPGTSLSEAGLRLDVAATTFVPGRPTPFSFTVRRDDGSAVTDVDVEQAKPMHLVLVDRALRRFAHLHPVLDPYSGAWTTTVTLDPGTYRAVADFAVAGERHALAVDLVAPGRVTAPPLPAPVTQTRVDGFDVALQRQGDRVAFAVTSGGAPAALEDYLGAQGHLVAFRAGDLAYSHVHPVAGTAFEAELPTRGTYRLFFQFQVAGAVHTAPFTLEV